MKRTLTLATSIVALAAAGFAVAGLTATKNVNIMATRFAPKTVTVAGGDTVQWKNVDTINHQVVANNGAFASGALRPGGTYAKRLDTPGTYPYHDALKPTLKGTVKVTGPPPGISIGASVPIATFGSQVRLAGVITPAATGDNVTVYGQPYGQASFVKLGDVQTATGGIWDLMTSPELLTSYKATWKNKTSAIVMVAVAPRLSLARISGWFVTRARAAHSFSGHWVYVQRRNHFGQWVSLRKVVLNRQSEKRFRLALPRGRSLLRTFMTTNQAGVGYVFSTSNTIVFRRR